MARNDQPIGLFDSGVGGLTVANAINHLLPQEEIIYFGDTAHLPYGDKSSEAVKYYSRKITEFLLEKACKLVLIACNTASATAYKHLKEEFGHRVILLDVINPVVYYLKQHFTQGKIGVIGTKGTINSGTYEQKISDEQIDAQVVSLATPLFVPMIEEGFIYDDISNAIIRSYLSRKEISTVDYLILGCTHYPIIKNQIRKFYEFRNEVLDSSKIVAQYLKEKLQENNLLGSNKNPQHRFFVSDYTDYFKKISTMFFEEPLRLEQIDFWK